MQAKQLKCSRRCRDDTLFQVGDSVIKYTAPRYDRTLPSLQITCKTVRSIPYLQLKHVFPQNPTPIDQYEISMRHWTCKYRKEMEGKINVTILLHEIHNTLTFGSRGRLSRKSRHSRYFTANRESVPHIVFITLYLVLWLQTSMIKSHNSLLPCKS